MIRGTRDYGEAWVCKCGWIVPSVYLNCYTCRDKNKSKHLNLQTRYTFSPNQNSSFYDLWQKDFETLVERGYINVKEVLCYKAYCELSTGN